MFFRDLLGKLASLSPPARIYAFVLTVLIAIALLLLAGTTFVGITGVAVVVATALGALEGSIRRMRPNADTIGHRVAFSLYSRNGRRGIDVHVRDDGQAFYVEREHVEGAVWKDREGRPAVGPYGSLQAAEAAAIVSPWFTGGEASN
jgi:hypothetical protein